MYRYAFLAGLREMCENIQSCADLPNTPPYSSKHGK